MTKQTPDLVIDKLGTHLVRCTHKDGRQSFKWDWDALLKEVQEATGSIVTVTEAKVKKTRKKKEV